MRHHRNVIVGRPRQLSALKTFTSGLPFIALALSVALFSACAPMNAGLGPHPDSARQQGGTGERPMPEDLGAQSGFNAPFPADTRPEHKKNLSSAQPRFKTITPLDAKFVSITFVDENYKNILHALAHAAGANLMIGPEVDEMLGDKTTLTAVYQERPVREVLDSVTKAMDISWSYSEGTIYIHGTSQRLFHLEFLGTVPQSRFTVGGDVLGGGGGRSSGGGGGGGGEGSENVLTPLTGDFELSGQTTDAVTDIYTGIENAVKARLGEEGTFFLNRQTGTLLVRARPRILEEIATYLDALREKYRRQVLIEAKIIEVELSKGHELGIDWRRLELTISKDALKDTGALFTMTSNITESGFLYGLNLSQRYYDVGLMFKALEEYGTLKTLSNPRLKAMNGQSAVISVGQSVSYLRSLEQETTSGDNLTTTDTNVEISSIFDGVLLGITPIIEADGTVNLHIVPIKSDLISLEEREFTGGNRYTFPRVNLREASTVVRARPGEILMLGGLIQDKKKENRVGVPVLGSLPVIGPAFRHNVESSQRVELVIIFQIQVMGHEQAV
ncbi:MAG: hypothetical protein K6360_03135 [Deltaproteobacteria bacterium]